MKRTKRYPDRGQTCPLADDGKINYFARKWRWKYFDRYPDIDSPSFSKECFALGFGMDQGKWLLETFPDNNVQSPDGLQEVINKIDDIFFLGTAIFSYWRHQTHWADCSNTAIFSDNSREWMLTALNRLIELTTDPDDSDFVVEEEFWGKSDAERAQYRFVKRSDGTHISANELRNEISVAGVFAVPYREVLFEEIQKGQMVILIREPENKYDANAIRIETAFPRGLKLGYIPRKIAAMLAVELDRGFDHIGKIMDLDPISEKILIHISRKEILPIDDITSITLLEFGNFPKHHGWKYKTTIQFQQKKFIRHTAAWQKETSVFELKFSEQAWNGFALRQIRRCNFLSWQEKQYHETDHKNSVWELIIRRGRKYPVIKFSGNNLIPLLGDRFQDFVRECQDLNDIKGCGRFYITP